MKPTSSNTAQTSFLLPDLEKQLDPRSLLYRLAQAIDWKGFEKTFGSLYSTEGRPALPIRRMVGLLMLKSLRDLSDEEVVEFWSESAYAQYFCGEKEMRWGLPCDPSELTHFRKRIGTDGAERILASTIDLHGEKAKEKEVVVDTTVQEKNITFPTDTKLAAKIVRGGVKLANKHGVKLRQSFERTVPKLLAAQRGRRTKGGAAAARKAARRLKTIAGQVVRQLDAGLPAETKDRRWLETAVRVLNQKRNDGDKIYSLHEPEVYCVSKGKEHKKYEFGAKASVVVGKNSGVILGAYSLPKNDYLFSYNWFLPQVSERIVVLLNNDLKVDENFLKPLVRPFQDSSIFSTSAKSLSWDGQEVTSAAFRACSHHGWYYWDNFESDKTVETLFAVGGFMALDRLKFLEIGGFDRLFFPAYGEDVDLCIRAKNQGWESIYVPESVVLHKEGASWKNDGSSKRHFISTKTHLLVQWRHFGGIRNGFRRTLYLIHEILRGRKNIHFMKAWWSAKMQWRKASGLH